MSEEIVEHQFQAQTIVDILSALGGLMSMTMLIFSSVAKHLNRQVIAAKFIRSMYFL